MMRIGGYKFSPRLVPTLVAGILLPILIGLGYWQLGRADQKRMIEKTFARQIGLTPVEVDAKRWNSIHEDGDLSAVAHRRVIMNGRFQSERQYLLDNRTRNGVAGFQVLTAFLPDGAAGGVMVNRGWIPLGERRDQLPALPLPSLRLSISGAFEAPRASLPLLGSSGYEQQQWPKIVQRVEIKTMEKQLELPLLPLLVLLDPGAPGGFVREWRPYYGISAERHQAYAFQWFALAAALAAIYIVVNLKRIDNG